MRSNFKSIVIGIFAVCFVIGIIAFASYKASPSSGSISADLEIWGLVSSEAFDAAYKASSSAGNKNLKIKYVQKKAGDFETELVEALSEGKGPDIILVRDDYLYKNRNKLRDIPFTSYPQRNFKDTFIQGAEILLKSDGLMAVPFMVDPLVMYWNRDIFSNNLVVQPPKYWDEFYDLAKTMSKKDSSANVTQSALSFGEWKNVTNAKDILSLLFLQSGVPIISYSGNSYHSALEGSSSDSVSAGQVVLNYYTQFSNPTSAYYSWNRSLPSSLNYFISGNLATYFGYASEIFNIQQKNPNLNFDVTYVPQTREAKTKIGFGHIYALAIVKQSKNAAAALSFMFSLVESDSQEALEKVTSLPPVTKSRLAKKPTDAYRSVFYDSALISRSWVDPDQTKTTSIFKDMIESITGGRSRVSQALSDADEEIGNLLSE